MAEASDLLNLKGRRVTVFGLGRFGGGVGVTSFLAREGARVTVADELSQSQLAESVQALEGFDVEAWLFDATAGSVGHPDLLVLNPGVKPGHWLREMAQQQGVATTSEIELLCARNRGRVIAVTGSNGKSTTAALIHAALSAAGRKSYLGGNIGGSLLDVVEDIEADDWVVLELSSFQLHSLDPGLLCPEVAVVTGFSPNHLNWHRSLDEYRNCKQRVVTSVGSGGSVVLPGELQFDDWPVAGNLFRFGADCDRPGVALQDSSVVFRDLTGDEVRLPLWPLRIPGEHNVHNSLAAACAAWCAGLGPDEMSAGFAGFGGLPYRLETVGEYAGRTFVNDSNSTTPESTVAALRACDRPTVLIAGGADKGTDLTGLAQSAVRLARAACWIGATAGQLSDLASAASSAFPHAEYPTLEAAFSAAVDVSEPGDIVILSPGCSSFGMYANYQRRGEHFNQLVRILGTARNQATPAMKDHTELCDE